MHESSNANIFTSNVISGRNDGGKLLPELIEWIDIFPQFHLGDILQ